jgi:hypothetical protein
VVGDQPAQLIEDGCAFRDAERRVQAAHMTVLADHPGPEPGGVLDIERFPQRFGSHLSESGGTMG